MIALSHFPSMDSIDVHWKFAVGGYSCKAKFLRAKEKRPLEGDELLQPASRPTGQLQFALLTFEGDFKSADGAKPAMPLPGEERPRRFGKPRVAIGEEDQGTRVENHGNAAGHSSSESGSVGS